MLYNLYFSKETLINYIFSYFEKPKQIPFLYFVFCILIFLCWYSFGFAHGGGLDQSGGHNCYVGSCRGSYHYHRGSSSNSNFSWLFWLFIIGVGVYYYIKSDAKTISRKDDSEDDHSIEISPDNTNSLNIDDQTISDEDSLTDRLADQDIPNEISSDIAVSPIIKENSTRFNVPVGWLNNMISLETLEKYFEGDDNQSEYLLNLKEIYCEGDEVWEYRSPKYSWDARSGSAGFALVRQEKIIFAIETIYSNVFYYPK